MVATTPDAYGDAALVLAESQDHIRIGQWTFGHEETTRRQCAITTSSVAISHGNGHHNIVEMLMLDWKMVPSSARTNITLFTDPLSFRSQSPALNESENSSFRIFQILPPQQATPRNLIYIVIVIIISVVPTRRVKKEIELERLQNWPNVEVNLHWSSAQCLTHILDFLAIVSACVRCDVDRQLATGGPSLLEHCHNLRNVRCRIESVGVVARSERQVWHCDVRERHAGDAHGCCDVAGIDRYYRRIRKHDFAFCIGMEDVVLEE